MKVEKCLQAPRDLYLEEVTFSGARGKLPNDISLEAESKQVALG